MKTFFIIDGNAYIHRAYHALPPLSTSNSQQINAVYGFIKLLLKIKNNFKSSCGDNLIPDYIAVCFDPPSKSFRYTIFKDYKANRKTLDEALISQMPIAREAAKALDIKDIEIKGYEADDLIATAVENNKKIPVRTIVVTGDKDILQLVEDENILVWNDSKNIMYDAKKVEEKYGVAPKQLADVFALMGDKVDNIPGVKGIGEKIAVKLVREFVTLENILDNADSIKGRVGRLLKEGREDALLSRKLVELNKHAPLDYKLENFKNKDLDTAKTASFFKKYEFNSLIVKYSDPAASISTDLASQKSEKYAGGFNYGVDMVTTPEKAVEVAETIRKSEILAIKSIIASSDSFHPKIIGVSLGLENRSFYFPLGHNDLNAVQISFADFKSIFAPLLSLNKIKKIGYDLKRERNIYRMLGIEISNMYFDTMLASYCLNPAKSHDISDMAKEYLNFAVGDEDYLEKGTKKISHVGSSPEDGAKYADSILAAIFALYKIFDRQIKAKNLSSLFFDIEMPLVEVLSEMEIAGIKVDSSFLHKFNGKIVMELKKIESEIYKTANGKFNINSPKQLASVMFDKLNLPVVKKIKTGYSTDVEVLTELSRYYDLPADVLKYRELQKLKSTYINPISDYCGYYGNRIHTVFNQAVTTTGRLSSTEPNLQNIPIKSSYGKEFRKAFVPQDGKVFISADYSQIDLRVLAHMSQDEKLMESFKENADIHSATAREIFGIRKNDPMPDNLRSAAKSINFGIVYGMSSFGLSKQLNIPVVQAKEYIDGYFERYSGVKLWMKQVVKQALKDGYMRTITGRIRYVPELCSSNVQLRNASERIALNTPIQGSSADIIKIAMINIYDEIKLRDYKSLMLLQVHDDLLFEVPKNEYEDMIAVIKDKMENAVTLSVPVAVDIMTGEKWGEMRRI